MNSSTTVLIALVAVLCVCGSALAKPSKGLIYFDEGVPTTNMCGNPENENICERCATVGRSPLVYDNCCKYEEGFDWCKDVIVKPDAFK